VDINAFRRKQQYINALAFLKFLVVYNSDFYTSGGNVDELGDIPILLLELAN